MAAYRRVYDSRHVQADCQEPGSCSSGTLRSVIECGLPLPFYTDKQTDDCVVMCPRSPSRRGGNIYKSVLSLVPRLSTRHCPHFLPSAVACCRSISPARAALSSKPAARRCCCRSTGETDRQTPDRFINPALRTMLFCSLAVLDPRVGHTMDVLSPFISVLCHSD